MLINIKMVLYKLEIGLWPFLNVYARNKQDIKDWQDSFNYKKEFYDIDGEAICNFLDRQIKDKTIQLVEKGGIRIDSGGTIRVDKCEQPYKKDIKLTNDFMAEVLLESIPFFKQLQTTLRSHIVIRGNLYEVKSYNGHLTFFNYIPKDVRDALVNYDISSLEEIARNHIEKTNRIVLGSKRLDNSLIRPSSCNKIN